MTTKLLKNTNSESHLELIADLIPKSDEICIATAFVKQSGVKDLLLLLKNAIKQGARVRIIAGRHFGLTEPEALWKLFKLFEGTSSALYLAKYDTDEIFHPKIYLFSSGAKASIIIGSANITNGGLVSNFECSLLHECNMTDDIWLNTKPYFESLCEKHSEIASRLILLRYELFFNEQKLARSKAKARPKLSKAALNFNYEKLKRHLASYSKKIMDQKFAERVYQYNEARIILDKMATSTSLSKQEFAGLLDELVGGCPEHPRYWHSDGLSRGKNGKEGNPGIYDKWKNFVQLVQFVKKNKNKNAIYVFENGRVILDRIPYAGINYLTEIMMTYNPDNFANLNNNPIRVLRREAELNINVSAGSYDGRKYEEYCELIKEINLHLGFRNMLEADSFFNELYWPLKKKGKFN